MESVSTKFHDLKSFVIPHRFRKGHVPKETSVTLPMQAAPESDKRHEEPFHLPLFHAAAFVFALQDASKTLFIHQSSSPKFFPFHPRSLFVQLWNSLVKISIIFFTILMPVCISMPAAQDWLHGITIAFVTINALQIIIRCNTGYIVNRTLEMSASRTRRRYFTSLHFVSDMFLCIPWVYIADGISSPISQTDYSNELINMPARLLCMLNGWGFISLLFWSKDNHICFLSDRMKMMIRYNNVNGAFVSMAMIIISMILYWHFAACGTLYTAYIGIEPVYLQGSHATTPMNLYSKAFFSVVSEMLSAGWAVPPPQFVGNTLYIWVRILNIIIAASFLAIFVGNIASIMVSIDSSGRLFQEKMEEVYQYTRAKSFDETLRKKIIDYFDFKYSGGKYFDEYKILSELNPPLKQLIAIHDCESLIVKVPFFASADPFFIGQVVVILKPAHFLPGDVIIREGTDGDQMFFIASGSVEVIVGGIVRATLVDGQFFGEIAVVIGKMKRTATVRALARCRLYSLSRADLNPILEDHPIMKEKLESIAKERIAANERSSKTPAPQSVPLASIPASQKPGLSPLYGPHAAQRVLKRPSIASSAPILSGKILAGAISDSIEEVNHPSDQDIDKNSGPKQDLDASSESASISAYFCSSRLQK